MCLAGLYHPSYPEFYRWLGGYPSFAGWVDVCGVPVWCVMVWCAFHSWWIRWVRREVEGWEEEGEGEKGRKVR